MIRHKNSCRVVFRNSNWGVLLSSLHSMTDCRFSSNNLNTSRLTNGPLFFLCLASSSCLSDTKGWLGVGKRKRMSGSRMAVSVQHQEGGSNVAWEPHTSGLLLCPLQIEGERKYADAHEPISTSSRLLWAPALSPLLSTSVPNLSPCLPV